MLKLKCLLTLTLSFASLTILFFVLSGMVGHAAAVQNNPLHISRRDASPGEAWGTVIAARDDLEHNTVTENSASFELATNHPPQALDVKITPSAPTDFGSLTLTYVFTDADGDLEGDTQLRWYRNSMLQPAYNDQDTVPGTATYREDVWCARVRPHDGTEYGAVAESNCVVIGIISNTLPQALDPAIEPALPQTTEALVLTYVYTDADGDSEGDTQLRWYRNDVLQPAFNDLSTVSATATLAGERWHASIRPHDGKGYGLLVETAPVWITQGITNTPPVAGDVHIVPPHPLDDDDLYLIYDYMDADDDAEGDTRIYWYKNLSPQSAYEGQMVIPAGATEIGDVWYAVVEPHDGQDYGEPVSAHSVEVKPEPPPNTPPEAQNVRLTPDQPGDDDQLELFYDYYDADEDIEAATQIHWTANGQPQTAFDGLTVIPADATSVDEEWCVTVTPHDGQDYGEPVSTCASIDPDTNNSPPGACDVYIEPSPAPSSQDLNLHYSFCDPDQDLEGDTEIRWYKDDTWQSFFDDVTTVPAWATSPGEVWYATVRPHDGQDYGMPVPTPPVRINRRPEARDVFISPPEPNACQALHLSYTYRDGDDDPASPTQIRWYRNNVRVEALDDYENVSASATAAGESWYAEVTPSDGIEYGDFIRSNIVVINSEPCEPPSMLYLPLLSRNCKVLPFEDNDKPSRAFGPLVFDRDYAAYPDDLEDWYYVVLAQTASLHVRVTDYSAKEGQLLVYSDALDRLGSDGRRQTTMEVPNTLNPHALENLGPGRYYVRVYSPEDQTDQDLYHLWVTFEP